MKKGESSSLLGALDTVSLFLAMSGVLKHSLHDNIGQIFLSSTTLLKTLLESIEVPAKGVTAEPLQYIIKGLLDRAADSNSRIKDGA